MKSIIFNQHQVNYALENKEGMFRVVCKQSSIVNSVKPPKEGESKNYFYIGNGWVKPKFEVGELIFVKEAFLIAQDINTKKDKILYRLDILNELGGLCNENYEPLKPNWKPAQYMKQEHSRLTLRIKSVKVERLQDISEEDAIAEGVEKNFYGYEDYSKANIIRGDAKDSFKTLWNSTHKKPEEKWEANPWVFVYNYEIIKKC